MRRAAVLIAVTVIALSVATAMGAPQDKWARGKVTAVSGNTLTIDVKGQPMSFTVDASTDFIARGASTAAREAAARGVKRTMADVVKVGDNVQVSYSESGGTMLAKEVRVGIAASAGTSDQQPQGAKQLKLEGVVTEVTGKSLTVKPGTGEAVTFMPDATIRVQGRGLGTMGKEKEAAGSKVTLTDAIAVGDAVLVTYTVSGTMNHATAVRVLKKKM